MARLKFCLGPPPASARLAPPGTLTPLCRAEALFHCFCQCHTPHPPLRCSPGRNSGGGSGQRTTRAGYCLASDSQSAIAARGGAGRRRRSCGGPGLKQHCCCRCRPYGQRRISVSGAWRLAWRLATATPPLTPPMLTPPPLPPPSRHLRRRCHRCRGRHGGGAAVPRTTRAGGGLTSTAAIAAAGQRRRSGGDLWSARRQLGLGGGRQSSWPGTEKSRKITVVRPCRAGNVWFPAFRFAQSEMRPRQEGGPPLPW